MCPLQALVVWRGASTEPSRYLGSCCWMPTCSKATDGFPRCGLRTFNFEKNLLSCVCELPFVKLSFFPPFLLKKKNFHPYHTNSDQRLALPEPTFTYEQRSQVLVFPLVIVNLMRYCFCSVLFFSLVLCRSAIPWKKLRSKPSDVSRLQRVMLGDSAWMWAVTSGGFFVRVLTPSVYLSIHFFQLITCFLENKHNLDES